MSQSDSLDLGDRIAEQAAHLDAATHRLLADLRAFDESGAWHKQGSRSCASWLSWRVGWDMRTANEHVRVANRLGKLPKIDDSLRRGEMSYAKVRAMVRVATPENEEMLLEEARYSTGGQLEKICRQYASVRRHDHDVAPGDDKKRRHLVRRDTADGMVKIEGLYHPEEAALIWAAVERIASERCREPEAARRAEERAQVASMEGIFDSSGSAEPAESNNADRFTKSVYPSGFDRADALLAVAEQVLRGTSPERAPIDLVLTASVDALTRPFINALTSRVEAVCVEEAQATEAPAREAAVGKDTSCGDPACTHGHAGALLPLEAIPRGLAADPTISSKAKLNADLVRRALVALQKSNPLVATKTLGDYVRNGIADPVPVTWIHPSEMFDEVAFDPHEVGLLGDGTCISSTAARRLACDCGLTSVLESEHGAPITIGRKRRTIPASPCCAAMARVASRAVGRVPSCKAITWSTGSMAALPSSQTSCRYADFITVMFMSTDTAWSSPAMARCSLSIRTVRC